MTYDPTVPGATQRISDTQSPIQTNFDEANTIFDEDHYTYNDSSGAPPPPGLRGFHRKTTFNDQAGDPTPQTDTYILYSKADSGGDVELFGIDTNSNVTQLTNGSVLDAQPGNTVLPGGMLMQWNRVSVSSGATVTFPIAFSGTPYLVNFTPIGASGNNRIFYRLNGDPISTSFSPILLNASGTAIGETIYYLAIGPR